jgi:rRNA maturation RNase YbeY
MAIKFCNDGSAYRLGSRRELRAWISAAIGEEGFGAGDITYIFCSPDAHLEMNRQYLGHDYHTDVITFDYSDLKGEKIVAGDIFIDPGTVRENAARYGATARGEMLRVLIHGVLHLCGYKDATPAEARRMRAREEYYLAKL